MVAVDTGQWYLTTARTIITPSVTTTTSTSIDPWLAWNATATATTTSVIWENWTTLHSQQVAMVQAAKAHLRNSQAALETPGQRAARQAQRVALEAEERRIRAAAIRIEGEKQLARQKAAALLERNLSPEQWVQLRAQGHFDVVVHSQNGERRTYRIHRGRAGNVRRLDEQGREVRRYCIHPVIACPDEDTMLTQKLWLENSEELFLRTANAS